MKIISLIAAALLVSGTSLAQAQHAHHAGHGAHAGHGGHGAHAGHSRRKGTNAHAGHGTMQNQTPSTRELTAVHHKMMRDMNQPYTGDPDIDFRVQMIPHHQGAIDMARVALRRANDPFTRQLAEAIIVEQQREIYDMRNWLARRGVRAPEGGRPYHIIGWNSYRTLPENPGALEETQSKSWAPGSGVPRQR